jgi:hypothetical protein
VSLLSDVLTLHQPGCDGHDCKADECIHDLEALCRTVLMAHLGAGVRKGGRLSGPTEPLTDAEFDDALSFLLMTGWELAQKFRGGRLAGYVASFLFMRVVDWRRTTQRGYGRWGPLPLYVEYDPRAHDGSVLHYDAYAELDDGREIDVEAMSAEGRAALELIRPLFAEELSQRELAARLGVPQGRVAKSVVIVRRELELQGLARGADMCSH